MGEADVRGDVSASRVPAGMVARRPWPQPRRMGCPAWPVRPSWRGAARSSRACAGTRGWAPERLLRPPPATALSTSGRSPGWAAMGRSSARLAPRQVQGPRPAQVVHEVDLHLAQTENGHDRPSGLLLDLIGRRGLCGERTGGTVDHGDPPGWLDREDLDLDALRRESCLPDLDTEACPMVGGAG